MPVTVKLIDLVALARSRALWPADFEALVAKLEDSPRELAHYGVIADWCRENGEPELADTFAWFMRSGVSVQKLRGDVNWRFVGMKESLSDQYCGGTDRTTLAGMMATLHVMLTRAREKVKKDLEELS